MVDIKAVWDKIDHCKSISDEELDETIKLTEQTLAHLRARGDKYYLAWFCMWQELELLKGFQTHKEGRALKRDS